MGRTKNGRPISDQDLDRMALEAEAGYDLTTWRRRPGRPSLAPSEVGHESPRLGTRVPDPIKVEFVRLVTAEGKTTSAKLRELVEDYVGHAAPEVKDRR